MVHVFRVSLEFTGPHNHTEERYEEYKEVFEITVRPPRPHQPGISLQHVLLQLYLVRGAGEAAIPNCYVAVAEQHFSMFIVAMIYMVTGMYCSLAPVRSRVTRPPLRRAFFL